MVPAGNKAKRLSSVNLTTKTIHHHHHHRACFQPITIENHIKRLSPQYYLEFDYYITFTLSHFGTSDNG